VARFSHDFRLPNESAAYRAAREVLLQEEAKLREQCERVASLRRSLPPGGAPTLDYVFSERAGDADRPVRLSQLFAPGKDTLLAYNFMYGPRQATPCPLCSAFLDGVNGQAQHLAERVNLVVIARSPAERLEAWRRERGWQHLRLLSSAGNTYNADYGAEDAEGTQRPMLHVWRRHEGKVRHFWGSELRFVGRAGDPRHLDLFWPLWQLLDLTPEGRGTDWSPQLWYG
jgi:predicted dithiol-disulfide oxidoreductase (DUF899 family)